MSEYQYYEFAAVDGPISDAGLKYAEGCSSRATVSRHRWQNTYHFGDFRGNTGTMLKYYDAHFYIANWGSVRFGLAFPGGVLSTQALEPYFRGNGRSQATLSVQDTAQRCVVWWERNDESGGVWTEGEGVIDGLLGIREELMRGDHRSLFLGWLADFNDLEWEDPGDGASSLPPIPVGLNQLTPTQKALLEQFPVDPDALAVAAELSSLGTTDRNRIPIDTVLEQLTAPEMRAMLARVAEGAGTGVMAELNRLTFPPEPTPVTPTLSCADFAAKIEEARANREKKAAAAATKERARQAEQRRQHLLSVRQRAESLWSGLSPLMEQRTAAAYGQAAAHLQDLHDAYVQAGETDRFQQRLNEFRLRYSNRPAMLRRIKRL